MTVLATLGDVARVVDCEHRTAPQADAEAMFGYSVGTSSVRNGQINLGRAKPISEDTFRSWTRRAVPRPGDLIFSREAPMGEIGEVPAGVPVCLGQRTVLLQPREDLVDTRFLKHSLRSPATQRWIADNSAGTTVLHLNVADVRRIPLKVLPPLEEQRRIADLLEDHLSRLDAGGRELGRARTRLRSLRASQTWSLTHGLSGVASRLSEVAEVRLGRQRSPGNHSGDNMRPYLRAANVDWDRLRLDDVKDMHFSASEVDTFALRSGDILVVEASGSAREVGKSAIYQDEVHGSVCFQNTLIRVRCHGVNPAFMQRYLLAEAMNGRFIAGSRGVGIYHIGGSKLAAWPVVVPSATDQSDAVRRLAEADAVVGRLASELARQEARLAQLQRSLLTAAFSGSLTSSWLATEDSIHV